MPAIIVLKTREEYEKTLKDHADKLVIVDFYADWCGPCRMIAPKLEKIAQDNDKTLVVFKVNVDDSDDIAQEQKITAMPTFKFYKNGKEVDSLQGASEEKLKEMVKKYT